MPIVPSLMSFHTLFAVLLFLPDRFLFAKPTIHVYPYYKRIISRFKNTEGLNIQLDPKPGRSVFTAPDRTLASVVEFLLLNSASKRPGDWVLYAKNGAYEINFAAVINATNAHPSKSIFYRTEGMARASDDFLLLRIPDPNNLHKSTPTQHAGNCSSFSDEVRVQLVRNGMGCDRGIKPEGRVWAFLSSQPHTLELPAPLIAVGDGCTAGTVICLRKSSNGAGGRVWFAPGTLPVTNRTIQKWDGDHCRLHWYKYMCVAPSAKVFLKMNDNWTDPWILNHDKFDNFRLPPYNVPSHYGNGDNLKWSIGEFFQAIKMRFVSPGDHFDGFNYTGNWYATKESVLPVIVYVQWFTTYGDWMTRGYSTLYHLRTRFPVNTQFIVETEGLALPAYIELSLSALSPLPVVRYEDWQAGKAFGGPCYEDFVIFVGMATCWECKLGYVYPAMQHLRRFLLQKYERMRAEGSWDRPLPDSVAHAQQGNALGKKRIVVGHRGQTKTRAILNLDLMEKFCATLHQNPGLEHLHCTFHQFGRNLIEDVLVANGSSMLLAAHGSEGSNSHFMLEDASLLEILPHGFFHWVEWTYRAAFKGSRLRSYYLFSRSQDYRPNPLESMRQGMDFVWPRDRMIIFNESVALRAVRLADSIKSYDEYLALRGPDSDRTRVHPDEPPPVPRPRDPEPQKEKASNETAVKVHAVLIKLKNGTILERKTPLESSQVLAKDGSVVPQHVLRHRRLPAGKRRRRKSVPRPMGVAARSLSDRSTATNETVTAKEPGSKKKVKRKALEKESKEGGAREGKGGAGNLSPKKDV